MANDIKVLISATLNTGTSIRNINESIKSIEKHPSLRSLSLTINFDRIDEAFREVQANFSKLQNSLSEVGNAPLDEVDAGLKKVEESAETASRYIINFEGVLKNTIEKLPAALFGGTVAFFSQGIAYVNSLDKSLNQIAMVTGRTQQEVQGFAKEYNNLAREMGVTTKDIADSSMEFYSQGLSQEQVMERVKIATEYAKVGNLEYKDSADILTATADSMNVSIERASDVFAYLGGATATGADEMGRAYQKVGDTAGNLGLSFEKTASWIAALSSRTHEGAETIGQSMGSILSRIQNLKENGFDDDGTKIVDVSKALAAVGIQLIDNNGNFADFGGVMDQLGEKWDSLDAKTKTYIATSVAGSDQQSQFLDLMDGYQDTLPLYEGALNSAGTTTQRFATYQQSTEASMNRFKTVLENLWSNSFNSDGIRTLIDAGTSVMTVFSNIVSQIGLLPAAVGFWTTAVALFSKNGLAPLYSWAAKIPASIRSMALTFDTLAAAEGVTTAATITLRTALRSLATTVLPIAIITGVTWAFTELFNAITKKNNASKELISTNTQNINSLINEKEEIQELASEYNKLHSVKSNGSATIEEKNRLIAVQKELIEQYGVSASGIDSENKSLQTSTEQIQKKIDALEQQIKTQNQLNETLLRSTDLENTKKIQSSEKDINKLIKNKEKYETLLKDLVELEKQGQKTVRNNINGIRLSDDRGTYDGVSILKAKKDIGEKIASFDAEIASSNEALSTAITERKNVLQNSLSNYIEKLKESGSSVTTEQESFMSSFLSSIVKDGKDIDTQIESVKTALDSLRNSDFQGLLVQFDKAQSSNDKSGMETTRQELIDLTESFVKGKPAADEFIGSIIEWFDVYSSSKMNNSIYSTLDLAKVQEEAQKEFKNTVSEIKNLNQVISDVSEGESLNADTVAELIDAYPELADHIMKTSDGWTIEKNALELTRESKLAYLESSKLAEVGITAEVYKQLEQRLGAYGLELGMIEDIASAREVASKIAEDKRSQSNEPLLMGESFVGLYKLTDEAQESVELVYKIGKIREEFNNKVKLLYNDPKLGVSNNTNNSKETNSTKYEPNINISKAQLEVDKYNRLLEENSDQIEKLKAKGDSYNKQLSDRIDLHNKLSASLRSLKQDQEEEKSSLQSTLSKVGLVKNGEVVDNVESQLVKLSKSKASVRLGYDASELESMVERYLELNNKLSETDSKLQQNITDLADTLQLGLERIQNFVESNKSKSQNKISLLGEINTPEEKAALAKYSDEILSFLAAERFKIQNAIDQANKIVNDTKSDESIREANRIYIKSLQTELDQVNIDLVNQAETVGKNQAEALASGFDKALGDLDYQRSLLGNIDTNKERAKAQEIDNQIRANLLAGLDAYNAQIVELERKLTTNLVDEERHRTQTKLETLQGYVKDYQTQLIQLENERSSQADAYLDAYKKMIQQERDIKIKAIEDQIDHENDRHKNQMEHLDAELKKQTDIINAQMEALDRQNASEDYDSNLSKLTKERQAIQDKINAIALDASLEAKKQREELQQQLADKNDEIAKMQTDRERELKRQTLEDELSDIEDFIGQQKDAEDKKHNDTIDNFEKQKEIENEKYKSILENEALFYDMKQNLMSDDLSKVQSTVEEMKKAYGLFFSYVKDNATVLGDTLSESILKMTRLDYENLDNGTKPPSGTGTNTNSNTNTGSTSGSPSTPTNNNNQNTGKNSDFYVPTNSTERSIIESMKARSKQWHSADSTTRKQLEKLNAQDGKHIDATFKDGRWTKNGLPLYHEGGEVGVADTSTEKWWNKFLLSNEVPAILKEGEVVLNKPANFISNIAKTVMSNLSSFTSSLKPAMAAASGTSIGSLNVNISGSFVQKDGSDIVDALISGLKKKGVDL